MSPWSERLARARPHLALVPAAALALIAAAEIVCVARAGADVPSEGDWRRATEALGQRHKSGDLIVVAPDWLDPVLRQHAGDLMPLEAVARMDDARFAVVWELSARGARAPETAGRERVATERFGDLTLSKWRRAPPRVVTDFVAIAGPGRVSLEEVGFSPRRCIEVVPLPDQTRTVRFDDVELGTELVGYVGLADVFTRRDVRDPGRLEVSIDGRRVAAATAGVTDGWVRFSAGTRPGRADVEFAATAVGPEARDRRICFAAQAREPAR